MFTPDRGQTMSTNFTNYDQKTLQSLLLTSQANCLKGEEFLREAKLQHRALSNLLAKTSSTEQLLQPTGDLEAALWNVPGSLQDQRRVAEEEISAESTGRAMPSGNAAEGDVTKTVAVPSSEHVAEIVGRQGCKIKALRTKTNTCIQTPQRGSQPVFIVLGQAKDVDHACEEILSAADHFTHVRSSRAVAQGLPAGSIHPPSGKVKEYLKVPVRLVGLVVGTKGGTVKRIQQITDTYIVTPGRDSNPVFEITGDPGNVAKAKDEILRHIAVHTAFDKADTMRAESSLPDIGSWDEFTKQHYSEDLRNARRRSAGDVIGSAHSMGRGLDNYPGMDGPRSRAASEKEFTTAVYKATKDQQRVARGATDGILSTMLSSAGVGPGQGKMVLKESNQGLQWPGMEIGLMKIDVQERPENDTAKENGSWWGMGDCQGAPPTSAAY